MTTLAPASISRRYGRILTATFGVVLLLSIVLVIVDYLREEAAERDRIALRLSERLVELNALARGAIDAVDALRLHAERVALDDGAGARRAGELAAAPGGWLTLDDRRAGRASHAYGNVITRASTPASVLRRDAGVAVNLGSTFIANAQAAPFLAWQHFVSTDGVVAVFPWMSSRIFPLETALRDRALFVDGTPERDPGRHRFWTSVEQDPAGKGPVVGVGEPVYARERFVGTVAALIQLEALDEIVARLRYPLGRLMLVDERDRVLAMTSPRIDSSRLIDQLGDVAPETRRSGIARAVAANAARFEAADGHLVFAAELAQAPWHLVYVVNRFDLARSIAARSGAAVVGPLIGLVLLLVVAHVATRREFVAPATQLVRHIDAAGREPNAAIPLVPSDWRPFFEAVSASFASHTQLVAVRQELEVARRMQEAILPSAFPGHPAVDLDARMIPALDVGGDFYDYFWLDETRLGVIIADVSDKGIGAALFMAVSRTLLRAMAPRASGPADLLAAASDLLADDNTANMFVTVFYGVVDVARGELVYANGGHNVPVVVTTAGRVEPLPKVRGAALGMFPGQRYEDRRVPFTTDTALFLYTDGVTEATSPDRIEFGVERLAATLAIHASAPASAMLAAVLGAVDEFASGQPRPDDITCVVVRRLTAS